MSEPFNTAAMIDDVEYIIDGHTWVRCSVCEKVIRTDGLFGGLHFCEEGFHV